MRLETINNNLDFDAEKVVTNPNTLTKDGEFSDDGVFSEIIFGKLTSEYEYSCKCGAMKGKYFEGYTCDKCGTKVEKCEATINKNGWIDLQGNYIINYVFYRMIEKILGSKLDEIIKYDPALDADGNPVVVEDQ